MAKEALKESTAGDVREEIHSMCNSLIDMLKTGKEGFRLQSIELLKQAEKKARDVHLKEKELTAWIVDRVSKEEDSGELSALAFVPGHLERIGDSVEDVLSCIRTMLKEGTLFTDRARGEVNTLFEKSIELLECVRDILHSRNKVLIRHVREEGEKLHRLSRGYALAHEERLIQGLCMPKASSVFLAFLDSFTEIERHTRQIVDRL